MTDVQFMNPKKVILVSEMSSESDPIEYATQEDAAAEPLRSELTEIDKILIQDKLNERGRVRDALTDTFRYAIIAVIAILGYLVAHNTDTGNVKALDLNTLMSSTPLLGLAGFELTLAGLVLALAGSRTAFLRKRLEILDKELNTALSQFSRSIDDSDLTKLAKEQWLTPLGILILSVGVVMFAFSFSQVLLLIRQLLRWFSTFRIT